MKMHHANLLITAIAPLIWGSTYIVTTATLANFSPMVVAMLRALPAGLLLLLLTRQLPTGRWWLYTFILGALNITLFLSLLFVATYRLPGGVAGTVLSSQPLIIIMLSAVLLSSRIRPLAIFAALIGMGGVSLLVLTADTTLDPIGIVAGLAGATSMALGMILTQKWQAPVSALTLSAWQLTAGGLLLLPLIWLFDQPVPVPSSLNLLGLAWLSLIGAAFSYSLWFRGLQFLNANVISSLSLLSPFTAVLLGWWFLDQSLTTLQIIGIILVLVSIWFSQYANNQHR